MLLRWVEAAFIQEKKPTWNFYISYFNPWFIYIYNIYPCTGTRRLWPMPV